MIRRSFVAILSLVWLVALAYCMYIYGLMLVDGFYGLSALGYAFVISLIVGVGAYTAKLFTRAFMVAIGVAWLVPVIFSMGTFIFSLNYGYNETTALIFAAISSIPAILCGYLASRYGKPAAGHQLDRADALSLG